MRRFVRRVKNVTNRRRLTAAVQNGIGHLQREAWMVRHLGLRHTKTPVFIMGCQRSGTGMLMRVIRKSPQVKNYGQTRGGILQVAQRLSVRAVKRRVCRTFASHVLFKPLNESQHADMYLDALPNLKLIWIYRDYRDSTNSAVNKWGDHGRETIRRIAFSDWQRPGKRIDRKTGEAIDWRRERLSDKTIALCKHFYHETMSEHEGYALFWYVRNVLFFELGLDQHPRVILVNYEDLVTDKNTYFKPIFDFIGLPYEDQFVEQVFSSSVGKESFSTINSDIAALVEDLQLRLSACYQPDVHAV